MLEHEQHAELLEHEEHVVQEDTGKESGAVLEEGAEIEDKRPRTVLDPQKSNDWRQEFVEYLQQPIASVDKQLKVKVVNYCLVGGELYRKGPDGILLKCLNDEDAKTAMG